jgi:hypothetical protein
MIGFKTASYSVIDRFREKRFSHERDGHLLDSVKTRTIDLKVFCTLHKLSMMQAITQAVEEWLKQHASHLGNETLEYLKPPY